LGFPNVGCRTNHRLRFGIHWHSICIETEASGLTNLKEET